MHDPVGNVKYRMGQAVIFKLPVASGTKLQGTILAKVRLKLRQQWIYARTSREGTVSASIMVSLPFL